MVRTGRVWIAEEEESVPGDGTYLLGTFFGHHESGPGKSWPQFSGLSAEAAIEWGRARSSKVSIRLGDGRGYFCAGELCSPGEPRWPPLDLPHLLRRRPPNETWKERTFADPPIEWAVTAWLTPAEWSPRAWEAARTGWDRTVAALAAQLDADGWDADELESMAAGINAAAAAARAAPDASFGWIHSTTAPRVGYRVRLRESASTREQAITLGRDRCEPPTGWEVHFTAEPRHWES
jgi:hypothetical protein